VARRCSHERSAEEGSSLRLGLGCTRRIRGLGLRVRRRVGWRIRRRRRDGRQRRIERRRRVGRRIGG
jgi:hypothetical protein